MDSWKGFSGLFSRETIKKKLMNIAVLTYPE